MLKLNLYNYFKSCHLVRGVGHSVVRHHRAGMSSSEVTVLSLKLTPMKSQLPVWNQGPQCNSSALETKLQKFSSMISKC